MTRKIFRSILLTVALVLFASLAIIIGMLSSYFDDVQEKQLKEELSLAQQAVEQNGIIYLSTLKPKSFRLTWVSENGNVLYDTHSPYDEMENHADREEIREAFESGTGMSKRYSSTLTEKTIYYASLLDDGTVLRISVNNASVLSLVLGMLQPIAIVAIIGVIFSAILAKHMAKRIVHPLNDIDLDHPLDNNAYDELSPLLKRIDKQHRQIDEQLRELQRKNDEFMKISDSMNEGLVLLDGSGHIISINPAARRLFNTDCSCIGDGFLTINRSHEMHKAIENALMGGHGKVHIEQSGREYRLDISRIESDGEVVGILLLALDVTEQAFAERSRKEFSANVSHELKTPLQSIIGSAELIENGLVKVEDMPLFIKNIRTESARLVALIEDIIRLSQLDEEIEMPMAHVDLLEVATESVAILSDSAAAKKVRLNIHGTKTVVLGVRRLLSEIVFNLCDNAIKYNVPDGSVDISISDSQNNAVLTVSDTGIGIPTEHHTRVFERFYRVDKSHSKKSGGTGLGLSIVKHAVAYHNAKISLESESGKGTTVIVEFPKS